MVKTAVYLWLGPPARPGRGGDLQQCSGFLKLIQVLKRKKLKKNLQKDQKKKKEEKKV